MLHAALPFVCMDTGLMVRELNDALYLFLISPLGSRQTNPCTGLYSYLLLSHVLQNKYPCLL